MSRTPDYKVSDEAGGFETTTDGLSAAQRLPGAGELTTRRMGAATVQRGVCRHEGSIRTEGEVDRGVLFYVIPCPELPLNTVALRGG